MSIFLMLNVTCSKSCMAIIIMLKTDIKHILNAYTMYNNKYIKTHVKALMYRVVCTKNHPKIMQEMRTI